MLKFKKEAWHLNWYPNAVPIRDRWGVDTNAYFEAREFRPQSEKPNTVLNSMRWSLGLM